MRNGDPVIMNQRLAFPEMTRVRVSEKKCE